MLTIHLDIKNSTGPAEALYIKEDVPIPELKEGEEEVLVRVKVCMNLFFLPELIVCVCMCWDGGREGGVRREDRKL